MKTHFTILLTIDVIMAIAVIAQPTQTSRVIDLSKQDRYPGGVYATWNATAKRYDWNSPQSANLHLPGFSTSKLNENNHNSVKSVSAGGMFHLVKDINTVTDGDPGNFQPQFSKQHYAVLNGVAYFSAEDGIHGNELWRSDGTDPGTYMVKDIEPGKSASGITNITVANGKIYFTATTSLNGDAPWISDGTETGTHILKDISAYANGGYPEMYTAGINKVYFFVGRSQLWVSDGTEPGTEKITISDDNSGFAQPVAIGNKLFFTTYSYYYGRQLWYSDGTGAGSHMVKMIGYFGTGPQQLTAYKNKLYFSNQEEYYFGRNLYVSDGTEAGTKLVENATNVNLPYYEGVPENFADPSLVVMGNNLYFIGTDAYSSQGLELYKYNPDSTGSPVLIKDITPGYNQGTNIDPYEITRVGDKLFFRVLNADGSATLWKTKGNDADTKPLKTYTAENGYNFYNLYNAAGTLFFEAYTPSNGFELWKSNGSSAGTVMVKDIFPGIYSSFPYFFTKFENGILFASRDEAHGYELRKSDGTGDGTQLVKNINQASTGGSTPYYITPAAGGIIFTAYDILHGVEAFYSDGTDAKTKIIGDIFPGDFSSYPFEIKTINDNAYFITNRDDHNSKALYKYNISTATLTKLFEQPPNYYLNNTYAVADNGLVFFNLYNQNLSRQEVWRTDGTVAGTFVLKSGDSFSQGQVNEMVTVGNIMFFPFSDPYYGIELYKSDGTVKGTKIFTDIYPGGGSSSPYSLFVYNNEIYFGAMDETYTESLWKANGTYAGTKKVAPIAPERILSVGLKGVYCISKGLLYINAYTPETGGALWITNGTHQGTKLLKAITPYSSLNVNNLTDVNGIVYFSANDGIYGNELWASNGKPLGTVMIKNLTPGNGGSNLGNFCAAGGKLYFIKGDTLWLSTGLGSKTKPVNDAGLEGVTILRELTASGNKLFVGGYTYDYGDELYVADVSSTIVAENAQQNKLPKENTLLATVSPNPVYSDATLQLFNISNADVFITDNAGKIVWQQKNINSNIIQIPSTRFVAGMYFINISSGNKKTTLKLVKAK